MSGTVGIPWLGESPLVSVITPTLNRRDMLADTLASVHLQDYPHVEHIVVDGGSCDGTAALLQEAERVWGVRWLSRPDGGMYEAINEGLSLARGAVVAWINSDDWLMPWTVSSVMSHMAALEYPHAIYGDYLAIQPGNPNAQIRVYGAFSRRALASVTTLAQPTVFWPSSFTDDLGGLDTRTYRQIADCEYWLRLSARYPFARVREFLALGQDHAGTKRAALAGEIEAEFRELRRQYRVNLAVSRIERGLSIARWRREWGALLAGRGWERTRASGLVQFPWEGRGTAGALLINGPLRRHPLTRGTASVGALMRTIGAARRAIDRPAVIGA